MINALNDLDFNDVLNRSKKLSSNLYSELESQFSQQKKLHNKTTFSIGCFSPIGREPRWYVQEDLAHLDCVEWFLPVYDHEKMQFKSIKNEFAKIQQWGSGKIDQAQFNDDDVNHTSGLDILIIPAVAFDQSLMRVGRGKGYFDRYLANQTSEILKIGVGFEMQMVDQIECDDHDVAMDIVITDQRIYRKI